MSKTISGLPLAETLTGDELLPVVQDGNTVQSTIQQVADLVGNSTTWGDIQGTLSNQTDLQNALNLKVPYTGATGNVNLGEYGLTSGFFQADLTPSGASAVGRMVWNPDFRTTDLGLGGGNVVLHIGQKQVILVVNKTGATLTGSDYQVVKISGAQGQRPKVALAQANNDANSADTIGIVNETITNNQEGFVCTTGTITNINTTGSMQGETWADGDVLYLSGTTAGRLTNIKPQAPIHTVIVGFVIYAHNNQGKIYVKVDNGYELNELHNVRINGVTDGQVLAYDSTLSVWENINQSAITSGNSDMVDGYNIQVDGTGTNPNTIYFKTTGGVDPSAAVWGDITGSIVDQTDLYNALVNGTYATGNWNINAASVDGYSVQVDGTGTDPNTIYFKTTGGTISVDWDDVANTPTTVSGYGITDAVTTSGNQTIGGTKTFSSTITGSITGNADTVDGYNVQVDGTGTDPNTIYFKTTGGTISVDWDDVSNTPTTVAGYGITDVFTETESDARFLGISATAVNSDKIDGYHVQVDGTGTDPNTIYFKTTGGTTSVAWGDISGTLSAQTDLQTALDGKYSTSNPSGYITASALTPYAPLNNPTFTGTVSGITKAMVGLGNVDNTADAVKSVSYATSSGNADTVDGYNVQVDGTGTNPNTIYFKTTGGSVSVEWEDVSNTPTTLSGYGITNAYTKTESDDNYPTKSGTGATGTWSINVSGSAGSVPWSGISSKPTTVSGFGITDVFTETESDARFLGISATAVNSDMVDGYNIQVDGTGTNPNTIYFKTEGGSISVDWDDVSNTPTTVAGYGITDAVTTSGNQTVGGNKTFSSTIIGSVSGNAGTVTNGVYTSGDQTIGGTKTFSSTISGSINGNSNTVDGYHVQVDGTGTDPNTIYFKTTGGGIGVDWDDISNTPTTVAGYGITDAVTTSGNQTIGGTKTFSSTITGSITGNAGTVTNGVYTTGDQTIGGTKTFTNRIIGSITGTTFSGDSTNKDNITTRTDTGFYETSTGTLAEGWPTDSGGWQHLISSTHSNDENYYALQIASEFFTQNLYFRNTNGSGTTAWSTILHSGNYNSYAPTLTGGGASGSWGINITGSSASTTGNAGTVTNGVYTTGDQTIAGIKTFSSSVDAPSFRDSANTAYYLDPANTGTSMVVAGNVGIGTASPDGSRLGLEVGASQVSISLRKASESQANPSIIQSPTDNSAVSLVAGTTSGYTSAINVVGNNTGYLTFNTQTAERMRITSAGNVGIGTSSPAYKLSVSGDVAVLSQNTLRLQNSDNTNAYALQNAGASGVGNSYLSFVQTGIAERMRLDSAGNLGIGTTSPASKLDVAGTSALSWGVSGNPALVGNVTLNSPSGGSFAIRTATVNDSYHSGLGVDGTYNGGKSVVNLKAFGVYSGGPYSSDLAFYTTSTTTSSEKMRIDSAGNLLVGGTSAVYGTSGRGLVTINGSANALLGFTVGGLDKGFVYHSGTDMYLSNTVSGNVIVQTNNTERMRIDSSGNVGIGWTSPTSARLVVVSPANSPSLLLTDNTQSTLTVKHESGNLLTYEVNGTATQRWVGNGSERMRIDGSGNVGIGTSSPTVKLDVAGSILASGNVTAYSDIRVKDNVESIEGAIGKLNQIRGVTYTRTDLDDKQRRFAGVIAQEIEQVLPEAVFDNGKVKAVDYNATIALLIEAVKEQQGQINELKLTIEQLKGN